MLCEQYGSILCAALANLYRTDACIRVGIVEALCQWHGENKAENFIISFKSRHFGIEVTIRSVMQSEKSAEPAIRRRPAPQAAAQQVALANPARVWAG
jgi:hypothetical protein